VQVQVQVQVHASADLSLLLLLQIRTERNELGQIAVSTWPNLLYLAQDWACMQGVTFVQVLK
jgi:hypothetical protein